MPELSVVDPGEEEADEEVVALRRQRDLDAGLGQILVELDLEVLGATRPQRRGAICKFDANSLVGTGTTKQLARSRRDGETVGAHSIY